MNKSVLIISERGITASNLLFNLSKEINEQKLDLDIDYAPFGQLKEKLSKKKYDLLVITPQAARHESELKTALDQHGTSAKIITIGEDDFHFMNVPHILTVIKEVV
ncbi:hypothetical protein OfM1_02110 [Lactovum odontotermitis]